MQYQNTSNILRDIQPNAILKATKEVDSSIEIAKSLDLPLHPDPPKNWDSLAAVAILNRYLSPNEGIKLLDAGGEHYSVVLRQLYQLGFTNLTCINLTFKNSFVKNKISFQFGDLTNTPFSKSTFHAITCLSVIEHGMMLKSTSKRCLE